MILTRPVRPLLVLLLAASTVAAPVPKGIKNTDAKLLEGRWVSVTFDGGEGPKTDGSYTLVIRDGKMWFGAGGAESPPDAPFTLDPTRSPKQLDVSWPTWKEPQQYVYELKGETLALCHSQPKNSRPSDVKGAPGGQICFVFKRVKE